MKIFKKASLVSVFLNRVVVYDLVIPPYYSKNKKYTLLLMNDGQDFERLRMNEVLEDFWKKGGQDFIFVGVHCNENRLSEYGTTDVLDFKGRGDKAAVYQNFVLKELLPELASKVSLKNGQHVFCGFSLGGLSAFDISIENSKIFSTIGVFSGALWWRSVDYGIHYDDSKHRIIHEKVKAMTLKPGLKFWFQCGTEDETADRNNNGIIDAIDDTQDLMKLLNQKGFKKEVDVKYLEVSGGKHNTETWQKAFPHFLDWAFNS